MSYQPPFDLTNATLALVAEIAHKLGHIEAYERLDRSPRLRKENRIRTIHSSLAIENNTLTLEQVTAVVDGRHVLAPPKDLLEVQNAIAVYDALDTFDPTSVDDLPRAHRMLMGGLVSEAGCLRSGDVGIFSGDEAIHMGTPARYVPEVMAGLFQWIRTSDAHPLVVSCVFHYEFEFIHPFQDGNGRMGRLWQTLILSRWNPIFAWLPVESLVKDHREEYYRALADSDAHGDNTGFVEFMLQMIDEALDDVANHQTDVGIDVGIDVGKETGRGNAATEQQEHLLNLLRESPTMTMPQMAEVLGLSTRQAERIVARLRDEGRLRREGGRRNGRWVVTGGDES